MNNNMETTTCLGCRVCCIKILPSIMESHMEKNMEDDMETLGPSGRVVVYVLHRDVWRYYPQQWRTKGNMKGKLEVYAGS